MNLAPVNGRHEPCEGAGEAATDVIYGTAICPVCKGIARASDDKIDPHDVFVIDFGEEG